MATFTRNLKLRLSDNLTIDAKYNLEKIDQIGSVFQLDNTQSAVVRSQGDVSIRPNDASIGGSGSGGSVHVGDITQPIDELEINGPIKILADNKYLTITHENTEHSSLSIDMGAASSFLLKLPITDDEVDNDAAIAGSKISPIFGDQLVSTEQGLRLDGPADSAALVGPGADDIVGADVTFKLPAIDGAPNSVLITDGDGNLSFSNLVGTGTVTSVDISVPSILTVSNNPITVSGTIAIDLAQQAANLVLAGPATGPTATPTFRQLSSDDLTTGATNLFYTGALFNASLATKTTSNLAEGTNLYHTALRAQDAIGGIILDTATADLAYVAGTSLSVNVLPAGFINGSSGLSSSANILRVNPTVATSKSSPVGNDVVLIADSQDSNSLKKILLSDIVNLSGGSYAADWTSGTSIALTHGLNSRDVTVEVYDKTTYETVLFDSVVRTDVNTVTITSSTAPSGLGLRVLIKRI